MEMTLSAADNTDYLESVTRTSSSNQLSVIQNSTSSLESSFTSLIQSSSSNLNNSITNSTFHLATSITNSTSHLDSVISSTNITIGHLISSSAEDVIDTVQSFLSALVWEHFRINVDHHNETQKVRKKEKQIKDIIIITIFFSNKRALTLLTISYQNCFLQFQMN